ncbi:MAG: hypothetical protein PF541_15110 [Prolixibacteraceae bacterium]|jgi:hypothetical protein|nr:hypothetical protein [Prolixibacteraceae bacterium]
MAGFFHTPKPKKFDIKPRYWNPEKEEQEARKRRRNAELGIKEEGEFAPHINKGEFRKGLSNGKWSAQSQRRKSNTRLLILVVIVAIAIYFMLK